MIPILYERDETLFTSNGLGRLRDCISCIVTEERNGIYECDFEYPISGAHYDMIQVGRIIGVTHDETDDVQPFDIVSYTKPIDGVVAFHAVHISYRQNSMTVTGKNINSLADAFTLLGNSTPTNPFTYETDKSDSGYMASADGVPKTVRQVLGGIEGSILDAYGGEYEWDKWTVRLHASRGQTRSFSIRYGVNMLDYEEEYDCSASYSSCIPYWTDGTTTVVGAKQTLGVDTALGHDECVPLDVSDKFENQPTAAQVNAMGLAYMNSNNTNLPAQNITVSFVRLQDMGEYAAYDNLLQCSLCDTINVIFPDFSASGAFKIVKTEWNVLRGRYETMELGNLSVTLADALGITSENKLTTKASTLTPSITRSSGATVSSSSVTVCNGVAQLTVVLSTSSSTAAGGNVFAGTLNDHLPKTNALGCGYFGDHAIIMQLKSSGEITIRNASSSAVTANGCAVSVTYVLD